jgi:hypothetical protein
MRFSTLFIAAALGCGLTVATVAPATAAQRTTSDPKGDTVATFDITKLDVNNKSKELSIKVVAPGFDPTEGKAPDAYIVGALIHTKGIDYYVEAGQEEGGNQFVFFQPRDEDYEDGNEAGEPCPGLRAVFRTGAAKLVIPQKCFGNDKGSVRVVAQLRGYSIEDGQTVDEGIDYTNDHPRHIKRG